MKWTDHMDRDEFSRQLKKLHNNVLFNVLSHHLVWVNLWPTEEKIDTLNRSNPSITTQ